MSDAPSLGREEGPQAKGSCVTGRRLRGTWHTCRSFWSRQGSTHVGLLRVHRALLQAPSGQTARFQNFEEAPVWGHLGGQEGPVSLSLSSGAPGLLAPILL